MLNDKICTKGIKGTRRIDLTIGISYDADITTAKALVSDVIAKHALILKSPAPFVAVKELSDSAVLLAIRPWVKKGDYTTVLYEITETIKNTFDRNNIVIPYPQVDTHITYRTPPITTQTNQVEQAVK